VENVVAADGGRGAVYLLSALENAEAGRVSGGLYRSIDGGQTWNQAHGDLLKGWEGSGRPPSFNTLGVCEQKPAVVYLSCRSYRVANATQGRRRHFGVLKTVDSGRTWKWVYRSDGQTVFGENYRGGWMLESYGPGYTGNPHGLGVSPANPDICYSTDWGRVSRTTDGGRTWSQLYAKRLADGGYTTTGVDVTTCYGVHFDPFDPEHLFITYTDIGLFQRHGQGSVQVHGWRRHLGNRQPGPRREPQRLAHRAAAGQDPLSGRNTCPGKQ
jgi:hypothetical protein